MNSESGTANSSGLRQYFRPTRREVLLGGGAALIGLTLSDSVLAGLPGLGQATNFPGVTTVSGAKKPVFVPAMGSTDPVAHSSFWRKGTR